jgi:hypothetical protein
MVVHLRRSDSTGRCICGVHELDLSPGDKTHRAISRTTCPKCLAIRAEQKRRFTPERARARREAIRLASLGAFHGNQ